MASFIASIIGLSLARSGYMAEIVRGGLLSVSRGSARRPRRWAARR